MIGAALLVALLVGQNPAPVPAAQRIAWDYATADITTLAVTKFQIQTDGGAWTDVGIPPTLAVPTPQPGITSYVWPLPALTTGDHTVGVRACNVGGCSDPAMLTFTLFVKPTKPIALRIAG